MQMKKFLDTRLLNVIILCSEKVLYGSENMKKEMTLSEFKGFCKGRNEIRYISDWKSGTRMRYCGGTIDFDVIAISLADQAIRLSAEGRSLKFCNIINLETSILDFGEIEVKITCGNNQKQKSEVFYIFFAPQQ